MKETIYQIADVHLRDMLYQRRSRGEDFLKAFEQVCRTVVKLGGRVLLVVGDFLDSPRPSPRIIEFLKRMQEYAVTNGLFIYVTSGNHDLTDPHWLTAIMDQNFAGGGFRVADNKLVKLESGLTIYGQPYVSRDRFNALKGELPPADILMFHTSVQEMTNFKSEASLPIAELPHDKYQVITIGDIHIRMARKIGFCHVSQSGSTELCSTAEDENKVIVALDFEDGKFVGDRDIPLKTRRVLRFKLLTEDQVEQALIATEEAKMDDPIVVVKYDPKISNLQQRFVSRIDPTKAILRFEVLFGNFAGPNMGLDIRDELKPIDFLEKFIASGTDLHTLGRSLMLEEGNATDLIDTYIEAQKKL